MLRRPAHPGTQLINALRGHLAEFGLVFSQGLCSSFMRQIDAVSIIRCRAKGASTASVHPDMWIRAQGVFEAIVERDIFKAARAIINARSFRLYEREGLLAGIIIDECDGIPLEQRL